jgi:pyrophosphatase PpaX
VFDADGTLIDTTELICLSFLHSCGLFAPAVPAREVIVGNIGLPLATQMRLYLGEVSDERVQEAVDAHMSYQLSVYREHLRVFDGIPRVLEALVRSGSRLAVATSRRRSSLELYLEATGLLGFFSALVTPEDTVDHKPHPAPALRAAELLGLAPSECLFVGDASFDVACGSRAGMATAFVTWGAHGLAPLEPTPTYVLQRPEELLGGW